MSALQTDAAPIAASSKAEEKVWNFVHEVLTNPSRLARGLEKMLEDERQPSSGKDEAPGSRGSPNWMVSRNGC